MDAFKPIIAKVAAGGPLSREEAVRFASSAGRGQ